MLAFALFHWFLAQRTSWRAFRGRSLLDHVTTSLCLSYDFPQPIPLFLHEERKRHLTRSNLFQPTFPPGGNFRAFDHIRQCVKESFGLGCRCQCFLFALALDWAAKIIKEANAPDVYLVIPERWEKSETIALALESRNADTNILYTGDFLNADRQARAKIHIVHVNPAGRSGRIDDRYYSTRHHNPVVDPFEAWFKETFPEPKIYATEGTANHHFIVSIV